MKPVAPVTNTRRPASDPLPATRAPHVRNRRIVVRPPLDFRRVVRRRRAVGHERRLIAEPHEAVPRAGGYREQGVAPIAAFALPPPAAPRPPRPVVAQAPA